MGSGARTLIGALCLMAGPAVAAECGDDTVWLRSDRGEARFRVDIADDPAERAQGLMHVEKMPASQGMLFLFEEEAPRQFWMRNTLIPLDIIFADAEGVVLNVQNAKPLDLTGLPSDGPAQFVLEINGGLASQLGIGPGTQMQHPAIVGGAWPCD